MTSVFCRTTSPIYKITDSYLKKYQVRNNFHASKSLTYFDDIQTEEWPQMILENDLAFKTMKKTILDKRDDFLTTW